MNNKTPRKYKSPVIKQLLDELTPVEKLQVRTKMCVAARLEDLITIKGWSKTEFAEKAAKNPSEITRWLSGTHNFTLDTLVEISAILNIPVHELLAVRRSANNKQVQVIIAAKNVQQSILYITPVSAEEELVPLTEAI